MPPNAASGNRPLSPVLTLVDGGVPQRCSFACRYFLLILFCLADFLDAFNSSSLYPAISTLVASLDMTASESTWLVSAFQLTFASFLLISGKISDVYDPKYAFAFGAVMLGCLSVGAGFATGKIALIVLRALGGIASALTIPSALALLVEVFPDANEQSRAIGVFGACGAVGNVLGLVIGAVFVEFASWSWVFWFVAILAIPIGGLCLWLAPTPRRGIDESHPQRWKQLDLIGVFIVTAALILLIFAITSGSTLGWNTRQFIASLVISVVGVAAFLFYETCIPASTAAVPPHTWFLPNFAVLFGMALLPFLWLTTVFTLLTEFWQDVYGWSTISVALRMVPVGVLALAGSLSGPLSNRVSPKYVLLAAQALVLTATVLLATADTPHKYLSHVLPAFVLGAAGVLAWYTHTNIAIFRAAPAHMAGTVGAIFNGGLQLGSAVGLAVASSIESSVARRSADPTGYAGLAAAFWFLLAIVGVEIVALLVFYRVEVEHRTAPPSGEASKPQVREQVAEEPDAFLDVIVIGHPVDEHSEKLENMRSVVGIAEENSWSLSDRALKEQDIGEEQV